MACEMASLKIASLLCFGLVLQFGEYVSGLSTDPPTENGRTSVVAALENATNVSIFCAVTFGGGNSAPRLTVWFFTEIGGVTREAIFGIPGVPNFFSTGPRRENLTIESFGRNFDMGLLECTNNIDAPNDETAFFLLRIISELVSSRAIDLLFNYTHQQNLQC